MPIACDMCPLRRCEYFLPFTGEELAFMRSFKVGEVTASAGTTVLMEGANSPQVFTVLSGMGTRYKTLEYGRRQVISFLFPGDFIGLQAGIMGEMKHSVEASAPMVLCVFNRGGLWNMFKAHPARAYDLTWIAPVEEHFLGETLAAVGQRSAGQRVAWALLRIHQRLRAVGMETAGAVPLAFRQQYLADALGSPVHTNKTLMHLRKAGLARWTNGSLYIQDRARLADYAGSAPEPLEKRPLM